MNAVIIGGSGATGKELVQQLLSDARFKQVTLLVRRTYFAPQPKLKEFIVDFDKLEDYAEAVQGADVAFSCLGTTLKAAGSKEAQWRVDHDYQLKFAALCRSNDVPRFCLLSAVGVSEKALFFYSKMRGTLETNVKKLFFPHLTIMQPSLIIRPDSDRTGEVVAGKVLGVVTSLGLFKAYRGITTANLAAQMIKWTLANNKALQVVGVKEMFEA